MPLREAALRMKSPLPQKSVVFPHRDPADTFLAASAKVYGLTLVTADDNLLKGKGYPVLVAQ